MQSKTVKEYVRQLTVKERVFLAIEIDTTVLYLNKVATKNQGCMGYRMARDMQKSDFNADLPLEQRFTPLDLEAHKALVKGGAQ